MHHSTFIRDYRTLEQRGVDSLNEEEKNLRRLPIQKVKTCESVFQPRFFDGGTAQSGAHLDELVRVLQDQGSLDPITVFKIGGEWFCIDGHHRLEAYQRLSKQQQEGRGKRRTHIPVKVFTGTLEEAYQAESVGANAPDKLNLSKEDKLESAWRLVLLGGGVSREEISKSTTISERTVNRMRRDLKRAREQWPSAQFEHWRWSKVKELLKQGGLQDTHTGWEEKTVKDFARGLAKAFGGLPKQHPRLFAQALLRYNPEAAKAMAEEILSRETPPSSPPPTEPFLAYPIEIPELDHQEDF